MEKIGIIGGGNLGMMMAEAAHRMGMQIVVLDPQPDCPCSQFAEEQIVADFNDVKKMEELCLKTEVVTYAFENVPYTSIKELGLLYNIPQGEMPLFLAQHRLREKISATRAGAVCTEYIPVNNTYELIEGVRLIDYPCVLKTCNVFDYKGYVVLQGADQFPEASRIVEKSHCILEKYVPFDMEISIVVTRSIFGDITTFPIAQNINKGTHLLMSIVPASISDEVTHKAELMAKTIMRNLGFVGTLTIEMFVLDEEVIFNEMAPHPHNSGNYTIEACNVSQFEQHIRAITGLPLENTDLLHPAISVSFFGQHINGVKELEKLSLPRVFVHDYLKSDIVEDSKMGHVTFLNYSKEEVDDFVNQYWDL
ncbi:MAG: purK [Bacteroidetes bacterium]|nr:purK [Bacteroidota bacterium]